MFDKLDAVIAQAIMSIGGVKGIELGAGFNAASMTGTQHNDSFIHDGKRIIKSSNNAGGILGGISDGTSLTFNAAFKPTPSISATQKTVNTAGDNVELSIKGRHDPVIVPRAIVVIEAMTCLAICDLLLINMAARMDNVIKLYGK